MRANILIILPLILGAALLTACVTAHPDPAAKQFAEQSSLYYWGQATFLTQNQNAVWFPPKECCRLANDSSLKLESRRFAIALAFGVNVRPGFNTVQMHKALPDTRWLDSCKPYRVDLVGGRFPLLSRGTPFRMALFPGDSAEAGWDIWFTLPCYPDGNWRSVEEAIAFLKGTHPDKKLRLSEFYMCYPLSGCEPGMMVEELHNAKGVGIKIPSVRFPELR